MSLIFGMVSVPAENGTAGTNLTITDSTTTV